MPQYDESFLIDCAIGEKKKFRSYSITSATTAAGAANEIRTIEKKRKRWRSFRKRASPPTPTHALYRSLYSLIENTDDTESICKLLLHQNDSE